MVTREQLLTIGLGAGAIDNWLATGRLHVVHVGVFALGHPVLRREGRLLAAVLACGPEAGLSHRSATSWLEILPWWSGHVVHVTVPDRSGRSRPGIVIHRPRTLAPIDVIEHEGIRCTSLARTLLDIAATSPRMVGRAVEGAERREIFDLAGVEELLARTDPRRRGVRRLTAAIAAFRSDALHTNPGFEARFLAFCRREGFPTPVVNTGVTVGGEWFSVDFLWEDARLIVETDDWDTHQTRAAFARDRRRDRRLFLGDYLVVRVTWEDLNEPRALAEELRILLSARLGPNRPRHVEEIRPA